MLQSDWLKFNKCGRIWCHVTTCTRGHTRDITDACTRAINSRGVASSPGFPAFSAATWKKAESTFFCVAAEKAGKPGDKATVEAQFLLHKHNIAKRAQKHHVFMYKKLLHLALQYTELKSREAY